MVDSVRATNRVLKILGICIPEMHHCNSRILGLKHDTTGMPILTGGFNPMITVDHNTKTVVSIGHNTKTMATTDHNTKTMVTTMVSTRIKETSSIIYSLEPTPLLSTKK